MRLLDKIYYFFCGIYSKDPKLCAKVWGVQIFLALAGTVVLFVLFTLGEWIYSLIK